MNRLTQPLRHSARLSGLLATLIVGLAVCPLASAEDELGRLFFTPERRQHFDRLRQFNIQQKEEIPADPTLTINGVVTRSSGKRTVWVNGVAQNEREAQSGATITPNRKDPGKVVVDTGEAPPAAARVGDTVNRTTGEATGLLGGGRIGVKVPSPQ